jgi:8-oxo-dGTP pyrophosphatase MutT (NUDIX family)
VARTIHLRRPATMSITDEPFVPDVAPDLFEQIEWRWEALRAANPHYYDGRLHHVYGVSRNGYGGAVVHVAECAYRYYAVQDDQYDLGVRPLGVKGVIERAGAYLIGKRSQSVGAYQGLWEFAPAGVVEPGDKPEQTIEAELEEETGLALERPPTPIAVLYDDVLRCWEIVFALEVEDIAPLNLMDGEYDELVWRGLDALPAEMTPIAGRMADLARRRAERSGRS